MKVMWLKQIFLEMWFHTLNTGLNETGIREQIAKTKIIDNIERCGEYRAGWKKFKVIKKWNAWYLLKSKSQAFGI